MTIHEATRTLLKSAPELWAECSDPESLKRHLDSFGEIRITRLEPETTVAWEGEHASGTVKLEPSGWGTRVILTAETGDLTEVTEEAEQAEAAEDVDATEPPPGAAEPPPDAAEPPPGAAEPAPDAAEPPATQSPAPYQPPGPESEPRGGLLARLRARLRRAAALSPIPEPHIPDTAERGTDPEPAAAPTDSVTAHPAPTGSESTAAQPKSAPAQPVPSAAQPESSATQPVPSAAQPESSATQPELEPPPAEATPSPDSDPTQALAGALESLGTAHHRPFSRS